MSTVRTALRWLVAGQLPAHLRAYLRIRSDARRLARSSLFDAAWYRATYSDVAESGANPALHYRLRGAAQGRRPGPLFDGEAYLAHHPELRGAGANPLLHCLESGQAEQWRARQVAAAAPLPRLPLDEANYPLWIAAYDTLTQANRDAMAVCIASMQWRPRFSILLSGAASTDEYGPALESLLAQTYPDWEALLVDPEAGRAGSPAADPRIRSFPDANVQGADRATGDFVLFLTPEIRLAPTALFEMAASAGTDVDLIYADEDRIDLVGQRHAPWFKPGWDPDLLAVLDFLGPACAWRRSRLDRSRLERSGAAPFLADPGILALDSARVRHVAAVLFHRRDKPASSRAVTRIHHGVPNPEPLVSVIVPTRDRAGLLRNCVDGVLNRTAYRNIELLIVDNDSRRRRTHRLLRALQANPRVRVLSYPGGFNWSAMNNFAAAEARGKVLVLLNNDVEVMGPPTGNATGCSHWLHELVGQALRPEIGAVGARLLYPDGSVQHAGITLGSGASSAHLMRHARAGDPHSGHGAATEHVRGVGAVTGACLAIRRAVFHEIGGLEDQNLAQTNNDVDLCLRLRDRGYRVIVTPHATLLHHEAASRGPDIRYAQLQRVVAERDYLMRRWGDLAQTDPYLNPNLTVVGDRLAFAQPAHPRAWAWFSSASPSRSSQARPRSA